MGQHLLIGLLAAAQSPASAPPVPPAPVPVDSNAPPPVAAAPAAVEQARTFTPADFARFAPRTAFDMLSNVPGFTIREQEERRGLGQATGNVIINGERFSGKSNDVVAELRRIAADRVVRIEIVDGATLDIPGLSGQVANIVVAASSRIAGTFRWRPEIRTRRLPALLTRGEVSINGKLGKTDYTLAVGDDSRHNGNHGREIVTVPGGAIVDRRYEIQRIIEEQPRINGRLHRASPGGTIWNLNASASYNDLDQDEVSYRRGPGQPDRTRRLFEDRHRPGYEVGGDYEFPTLGGKLKLIGLRRAEHSEYSQLLTVDYAGNALPATADRYAQESDEAETIARTEFRWKGGKADWQISLEGAVNSLDFESGLFTRIAGVFQPIPFTASDDKVEERRAEAILSYGRPLAKKLTLQLSAGAEYSRLEQQTGAGATRDYLRPKGSAALAWKPRADLDLSLKLERSVGQLSFFDFVASRNISAETANAGNVNLVPPQSWDVELQGTRNLGVWGTTTLRGYANFIEDIVDVIPIGVDGQSPGNLKSAIRYGAQWTSTANFDPIGWKGARLELDIQFRRSRLTDPLTGERREINESLRRAVDINFRQDIPKTDWAYGFSLEDFRVAPGYRLDQKFQVINRPAGLNIFVENKDVLGMTVRGSLFGLTHASEGFDRTFYNGFRTNGALFTESRRRHYGLIFQFDVRGKF